KCNYSAPQVPNAAHSGLWASRGAPRLVRPGKKIKIRAGELARRNVFDFFSGVLNNYKKVITKFPCIQEPDMVK
ncbi:MAG: hypothetical protein IJ198_13115, partial [Lachnospiraceae bacterium]|nr:hypothetical protein [Lachnospiraceae bacterium]